MNLGLSGWHLWGTLVVSLCAGACSGTSGGGGGGGFLDIGACDAKADAKCSGGLGFLDVGAVAPDTGAVGLDGSALGDGTTMDDAAPVDDVGFIEEDVEDPDAPDYGGFFDDDVQDPADTGPLNSDCNERAKIVYVVTAQNVLLSFNPDTLVFKKVGTLNCPAGGGTPFSMSVDRNADAWVLYQVSTGFSSKGGGIFKVSTLDASCTSTSYVANSQGLELFGMGFSANSLGSKDETLFVAGAGASNFQSVKNTLATIDFPGMGVTKAATLDIVGGADLTGNGKGELFGFFPDTTPPAVRQVDKVTGVTTGQSWKLPANIFGNTEAWAFAQWGGNFFLFFKTFSDASSNVYKLDTSTGAVTKVASNVGYKITGAGVSSCAPSGVVGP